MKKLLLGIFTFLMAATCGSAYAHEAYANFFSISSQPLNAGDAATFDLNNSVRDIDISVDRKTVTFEHGGHYAISFVATGGLSTSGTQFPGPWSVGLLHNGILVNGSVAAADSGTEASDNLITLTTTGEIIIRCNAGDTLQLINTTSNPIQLEGTVSGGANQNTSVSISIVQIS